MKPNKRELEKKLKALANLRRIQILVFLKKKGEAAVGEIADSIKLSFRSTSKHLTILQSAGIVEKNQLGVQVFYHIVNLKDPIVKNVVS